jgi:hypothetical protein
LPLHSARRCTPHSRRRIKPDEAAAEAAVPGMNCFPPVLENSNSVVATLGFASFSHRRSLGRDYRIWREASIMYSQRATEILSQISHRKHLARAFTAPFSLRQTATQEPFASLTSRRAVHSYTPPSASRTLMLTCVSFSFLGHFLPF